MCSMNLNTALDIINNISGDIDRNINFVSVVTAFRYLRNLCGTSPEIQNEILQDSNILLNTKKILFNILTAENLSQEKLSCSQIGLQFLGNLIVNNKKNQEQVWLTCQDLLDVGLKFEDAKVQSFCAMITYNIFLGKPELLNQIKHSFEDFIELTLKENTSEFAILTLEILILKSDYIFKYYEQIKLQNRLIILEIIKNLIKDDNNQIFQGEIITFFSKQFTKKSDLILKTCENYISSLDPVEITKILDLLVAFSADDKQCYLKIIQHEMSLLINCILLLKNMHLFSKQIGNNFSMITKISEISEIECGTSVQEHPAFGFKCSLIRLIGNMCWKNKTNQDKARELECIPVLLDCCNIDARNPFIMQWCILAIHNICEKNPENQQIIASLSKENKVDYARIQELGITLNTDMSGDAICIAPLKEPK